MKKSLPVLFFVANWLPVFFIASVLVACATWKQAAHTVLDELAATCIVINSNLDIKEIQAVCDIADDLIPTIKKIVDAAHTASAKAGTCSKASSADAGTDAAK